MISIVKLILSVCLIALCGFSKTALGQSPTFAPPAGLTFPACIPAEKLSARELKAGGAYFNGYDMCLLIYTKDDGVTEMMVFSLKRVMSVDTLQPGTKGYDLVEYHKEHKNRTYYRFSPNSNFLSTFSEGGKELSRLRRVRYVGQQNYDPWALDAMGNPEILRAWQSAEESAYLINFGGRLYLKRYQGEEPFYEQEIVLTSTGEGITYRPAEVTGFQDIESYAVNADSQLVISTGGPIAILNPLRERNWTFEFAIAHKNVVCDKIQPYFPNEWLVRPDTLTNYKKGYKGNKEKGYEGRATGNWYDPQQARTFLMYPKDGNVMMREYDVWGDFRSEYLMQVGKEPRSWTYQDDLTHQQMRVRLAEDSLTLFFNDKKGKQVGKARRIEKRGSYIDELWEPNPFYPIDIISAWKNDKIVYYLYTANGTKYLKIFEIVPGAKGFYMDCQLQEVPTKEGVKFINEDNVSVESFYLISRDGKTLSFYMDKEKMGNSATRTR